MEWNYDCSNIEIDVKSKNLDRSQHFQKFVHRYLLQRDNLGHNVQKSLRDGQIRLIQASVHRMLSAYCLLRFMFFIWLTRFNTKCLIVQSQVVYRSLTFSLAQLSSLASCSALCSAIAWACWASFSLICVPLSRSGMGANSCSFSWNLICGYDIIKVLKVTQNKLQFIFDCIWNNSY